MSTYDAYTLSMRDSTEFTVPVGGGSDSCKFSIAHITFDFRSVSEEILANAQPMSLIGNFIVKTEVTP